MQAKTSQVVRVTGGSFENEVLGSQVPVLVDFWAPWCIYCKKLAPVYEALAPKFAGKVKFASVNVDEEPALQERFGVMSLPTLKVFCGGREVGESVGFMGAGPFEQMVSMLDKHALECMNNSTAFAKGHEHTH